MFKLLLRLTTFILLLVMGVSSALAQNPPPAVTDAINDYNRQNGTQYTVDTMSFLWEERLFNNEALGCARLNSGLTPKSIIGYQVTLYVPGRGEYDYRISYTPAIIILCSPYTPPTLTPSPTFTPPPAATPAPGVTLPPPVAPSATVFVPVPPTPTPAGCAGLAPRLQIGIQGRVRPDYASNLREQPSASTRFLMTIPEEGVFNVLEGPRCTGDGTWWQVTFNGTIGWMVEGNNGEYYVEPLSLVVPPTPLPAALPTLTAPPVICDPVIPSRLRVGEQARVTIGGIPNNVRDQPGRSARLIGEIPPGGEFAVLDGPRCTGDGAWFQVTYGSITGWTIEGMEGEYWLEPLSTLEVITPANLLRLRPVASLEPGANYETRLIGIDDTALIYSYSLDDVKGEAFVSRWSPPDSSANAQTTWTETRFPVSLSTHVAFIPAQNRTLALRMDSVRVVETVETITTFTLPGTIGIQSARFHPAGSLVAAAIINQLLVMSLDSTSPQFQQWNFLPAAHTTDIRDIAFSRDGAFMATLSLDYAVVWNTADWSIAARMPLAASAVDRIVFSLDGRWLAVVLIEPEQASGTLLVWDKGTDIRRFFAPAGMSYGSAAFMPDSRYVLAAGGLDSRIGTVTTPPGYVDLWDIEAQTAVAIASAEPQRFSDMMLNETGTLMVTLNESSNIQVWAVQP